MTPLEKIRTGITEQNWELVVDGYNKLNPTNKVSLEDIVDDEDEDDEYEDEEYEERPQRRQPRRRPTVDRSTGSSRRSEDINTTANNGKKRARTRQVSGGLNLFFDDLSEHKEDIPVVKPPLRPRRQRRPSKPLPDSISIE